MQAGTSDWLAVDVPKLENSLFLFFSVLGFSDVKHFHVNEN